MTPIPTTKTLHGIPASPGIAIGQGFHYTDQDLTIPSFKIRDVDSELDRLDVALATASVQLTELQAKGLTIWKIDY